MPNYPKDQQLKPVTFSDFSPGIVQRTGVLGATQYSPAKIGAASPTNTYRCIALPGGGLGPLPKRVRDFSVTDAAVGATYAVTGFGLFGPMFNSATAPVFNQGPPNLPYVATTPFEIHLIFDYIFSGDQHTMWRRYRYFSDNGFDVLKDIDVGAVTNRFPAGYTTQSRANPGSPGDFGPPVFVASLGGAIQDSIASLGEVAMFPDPAAPTTTTIASILSLNGGPILGHQNRVVQLARTSFAHGAPNYGYTPSNEFITYTLPNDVVTDSSVTLFGQEYPVGYGAWGSLSSSDLLLIKHTGGAFLVQGDLNTPIIRRFPGVTSTGGAESVGASTPLGFIYGVNNDGVYAWQGGDTSVCISPQLEDGFWISGNVLTYLYKGTFLGWGSWVLAPNDYLFDTQSQSWWRIDDPSLATHYIWQRDPVNNVVYGARTTFSNADKVYASGYDKTVPAVNYSWQSQPFGPESRRRVRARAVSIVAQGSGTVTVTIVPTDSGEAAPIQPNAFTINTSGAVRQTANTQTAGTEFVLRIVSDGGSSPAPIVQEVSIDFEALSQPTMAS